MSPGIRYVGHENENAYRSYPFAEGTSMADSGGLDLATDVLADAILHPVVEEVSRLRLSSLDFSSGRAVVVDEAGHELSGTARNGSVELRDSAGRRSGTLVCGPGWEREVSAGRTRTFNAGSAELCAAVCCPVVYAGVSSVTVEGVLRESSVSSPFSPDASRTEFSVSASGKAVVLEGDDAFVPVLDTDASGATLSFDAQAPAPGTEAGVRGVLAVVTGQTLFDILRVSGSAALVTLPPLDREDVCWQARKEDAVAEVVDVCDDEEEPAGSRGSIGFRREEVMLRPTVCGSVDLVADDAVDYRNPLLISTAAGETRPQVYQAVEGMSVSELMAEGSKLTRRPVRSGNVVRISIPGLENG